MEPIHFKLLALLREQAGGVSESVEGIREIAIQICGTKIHRDPVLTSQQIQGLETILREWNQMFSFQPGRPEGLPALIGLVEFIGRTPDLNLLELYVRPEWAYLLSMRGPVEVVQVYECGSCQIRFPRMGLSGFLDLVDLICESCGAVTFRSIYSDEMDAQCECGGRARLGCPQCGGVSGRVVLELSPYEYFRGHGFKVEKDS